MKLTVDKIDRIDQTIFVTTTTDIGQIKGIWHFREEPVIGAVYHFEITIPEFDRSEVQLLPDRPMPQIRLCGDCVHFVCTVEAIDEDYVYVVRLAQDWLEIIGSIGNDDHTIREGDCVSFSARCDEVGIYVFG